MRVFVTGGTGHAGSHIIPELIAAGHQVFGLARSDESAATLSALGAGVRRGDLEDLDGLKAAAADSDGVIHVAHRQDLLPSGGMDAVAAAELPIVLAYGQALEGTGKPLVAAGSIGSAGNLGRPATEEDAALPSGEEHKGTLRVRNVVERAVVGLAERGVRSSIVRLPLIAHSTVDSAGFLPGLIALAREKGFAGYLGDGANLWCAVHISDVASVFRLALEKGPPGRYWHAITEGAIPFREIAEAIGRHLDLPAVSVPEDVLMLPGYFGQFTNLVTGSFAASNLSTRQDLGWEPTQPSLFADLDNGHYFSERRANGGTDHTAQVARGSTMTTFAPHRDTLEAFVDCINDAGDDGVDAGTLHRLLAEDVVIHGPFGDDPVIGRATVVDTIRSVNGLSSDDTYAEVLSGPTHHAAQFRLQVADAAVDGIFLVLLDEEGKIAEVSIFYRTLPAGVAIQQNMAAALGWQPWKLHTTAE